MTDAIPVAWASRSWLANRIGGNFSTAPHPSFDVPLYDQAALDAALAATHADCADGVRLMAAEIERLRSALLEYMAAFGQGFDAHGIVLGSQQIEATGLARAALRLA